MPALAEINRKLRVAVLGASGYAGSELVRLLLDHPHAELAFLSSERHAGRPVAAVLGSVRNHPRAARLRLASIEDLPEVDVAFGCLPTGELPVRMDLVTARSAVVLNLAGDFRLTDRAAAAEHYPRSAVWSDPFVYYVPEFSAVPDDRAINLPGCMAVATLYAVQPMIAGDLIAGDLVIDAKTGASGGGQTLHEHPADRIGNFRVHKPHGHRHGPEIAQALRTFTGRAPGLRFATYSLDVARGVMISAYAQLRAGVTALDLKRAYGRAYANTPFVRVRAAPKTAADYPMLKAVIGSNMAEVAVAVRDGNVVAVSVLDNLVKGAAGQAVQAFNLIHGFDQALGLPFTAVAP
jgi:N-acetyl-gamma-glutamyl-phosphate reductase